MRIGVWWGVAVLTALAFTSAQRPQASGVRTGRRLSSPAQDPKLEDTQQDDEIKTSFRPRSSRRKEETSESTPREFTRTRTRSRPATILLETTTQTPARTERFYARRTNSNSERPVETDTSKEPPIKRMKIIRTRYQQNNRQNPSSTPATVENSSPVILRSEAKLDSNLDDVSKTTPKQEISSTQFRRRSSISTEPISPIQPRRRINVRPTPSVRASDLAVSGTTNSLHFTNKEQPMFRNLEDSRNSKKLRYRTRFAETDNNLTGEGMTATVDVTKSSQIKETTSQPETTLGPIVVESMQTSSEEVPVKISTTTERILKSSRRPGVTRGRVSFKPSSQTKIIKNSDEISEDDNYPESFKALLQKNAATQPSSPPSESLSVKASEKSYKTYSSSALPPDTNTTKSKFSRFRSKNIGVEEHKNKGVTKENQVKTDEEDLKEPAKKPEKFEHKSRGFTPRNRKTYSTTTTVSGSSTSTQRTTYKFQRKFRTTTESPNIESTSKQKNITSSILKKSLPRPYRSRKYDFKNLTETNNHNLDSNESNSNKNLLRKPALPKTSYYTRSRNNKTTTEKTPSSTVEALTEEYDEINETPADKKKGDNIDMPLIFSLLKSPNNNNTIKVDIQDNKDSQEMFIIAVSSKESAEKSAENEVMNKKESVKKEEENVNNRENMNNKENVNNIVNNSKYHANFKGKSAENEIESKETVKATRPLATPSIRNIHVRTNGAQKSNGKEHIGEGASNAPKSRNSRYYADSYSKTTESTTNSISSEPEIHKARFSSKYKASLNDLNKPYYKPTVPTVTPSTAWLKFFVTDHQLAKSVQGPRWFNEDLSVSYDVTTEMSTPTVTPPSSTHESSIELVEHTNEYEYEEYHLGPDMNAISITLPRSNLSSADLRLSESMMKPFHIANIETSQHSASVTVSIFDALADILTSTPRTPRLSSTTEVKTIQNYNDKKQTLNGVSNSINVNSAKSLTDTFTSNSDVSIVTKSVQTTVQTTPNVNNQAVVDKETSSLNPQGVSTAPLNISPTTTPAHTSAYTSIPTTPISARKPFAIKVLYADTETPTDPLMTTTLSTQYIQPSTDKLSTVLSKNSNILLANNNLVSSQLTSMLTNNINDLLKNMDEDSRNKLSIDMAKLLRNLIPRALDGLKTVNDDIDVGDNTTPYSLEDIKDTENVNMSDNINTDSTTSTDKPLQAVETQTNVNSTLTDGSTTLNANVNSTSLSPEPSSTTLSTPSSQTTTVTSQIMSTTPSPQTTLRVLTSISEENVTSSGSLDDNRLSDIINTSIPLPFFTNAQIKDFVTTVSDTDETTTVTSTTQIMPLPLVTNSLRLDTNSEADTQDSSRVSSAQLWVLSKKARVLQMIEDLIRQHHDEIATASPLTEMINQENNIPLSDRLTEILNTMTSTTETSDSNPETSSPTSAPLNPVISFTPISVSSIPSTSTTESIDTATTLLSELTPRLATPDIDNENKMSTEASSQSTTLSSTEDTSTPPSQIDMETTTSSANADSNTDSTIMPVLDQNTRANLSNTNTSSTVSSNAPDSTSTIPKRDYVIFGILPNNTVVRKDPNDDILETITESSPYIIYSVLPNNTVIRRFPNGTRVPRFMQKIDVLPISPWSLKNPYSPIHNNPAIVRPRSNQIRVSTNTETPTDKNNGTETKLTNDSVNNQQTMIPTSAHNINDSSSFGVTTDRPPTEKSTASHVLSLRTTTMLPSIDEILLNSISSAAKEEMVISSMTSSTREPRILTLDIDPETKQIRTEKPGDGNGNAKFKFIPIDEVSTAPQDTNVLKLASKSPPYTPTTEMNTQSDTTTTERVSVGTPVETSSVVNSISDNTENTISLPTATTLSSTTMAITTLAPTTTESTTVITTSSSTPQTTTTISIPITIQMRVIPLTTTPKVEKDKDNDDADDAKILQSFIQGMERNPKSLNVFSNSNQVPLDSTTTAATKKEPTTTELSDQAKILQVLLAVNQNPTSKTTTTMESTTRSIEDDIKQFEEDTKLLKALLAATGQNPDSLNIPTLELPKSVTNKQSITPQPRTTTTTTKPTTTQTTDDLTKLAEDAQFLQTLLQAGQMSSIANDNLPIITEVKPVVRIASPSTKTTGQTSNTQNIERPVYRTTPILPIETNVPSTTPILTNLQTRATTESLASTTNFPRRRQPSTTASPMQATRSRRPPPSGFTMTTEVPSTSTFSDAEDILFLKNLKMVLKTSPDPDDPEAALANRIVALAVERSLNEITSGQEGNIGRTGKTIAFTTTTTSTTTTTTTTTPLPITVTPSLADDIKRFEEDTKLLQALIKATGQDPSKFNIPTLPPNINTNKVSVQEANRDAKLIAFPSPPNDLDQMSPKPSFQRPVTNVPTSPKPFGAKIAVKDDPKNVHDDGKLLKTLITLQGAQETTTQRNKLTITGQSPDEALNKLINRAKPANTMMSDSTKSPVSISTEFGKSNDALLAALLKEQGFGPTTASSLDEQLRLAALLNQVVVTPKTRRTTTPPPPPPPRRPVLDGLAWLWQQWRETGPGPNGARPSRRPSPSQAPATSNRVNWFGSGPFVGNADDQSGNRVPLEPPSAASSQGPGRGQLVSAAINVTRAFSQFLGAALQGAAQTFQSVIQAGQRAAGDVYRNGSGSTSG